MRISPDLAGSAGAKDRRSEPGSLLDEVGASQNGQLACYVRVLLLFGRHSGPDKTEEQAKPFEIAIAQHLEDTARF